MKRILDGIIGIVICAFVIFGYLWVNNSFYSEYHKGYMLGKKHGFEDAQRAFPEIYQGKWY